MKKEFISKWSNWWMLQKNGKELTEAFEKELEAIIEWKVNQAITISKFPKSPFLSNLIQKHLKIEKENLDFWNNVISENNDELSVKQAEGNIPNCEYRIKELEKFN